MNSYSEGLRDVFHQTNNWWRADYVVTPGLLLVPSLGRIGLLYLRLSRSAILNWSHCWMGHASQCGHDCRNAMRSTSCKCTRCFWRSFVSCGTVENGGGELLLLPSIVAYANMNQLFYRLTLILTKRTSFQLSLGIMQMTKLKRFLGEHGSPRNLKRRESHGQMRQLVEFSDLSRSTRSRETYT